MLFEAPSVLRTFPTSPVVHRFSYVLLAASSCLAPSFTAAWWPRWSPTTSFLQRCMLGRSGHVWPSRSDFKRPMSILGSSGFSQSNLRHWGMPMACWGSWKWQHKQMERQSQISVTLCNYACMCACADIHHIHIYMCVWLCVCVRAYIVCVHILCVCARVEIYGNIE